MIELNILLIEDSEADFLMLSRHLRKEGITAHYRRVEHKEALVSALSQNNWDIVLSDYTVPGFPFSEILTCCLTAKPDLPIIVVSGTIGEESAVGLLKEGVQDFILKANLTRLVPAINQALEYRKTLQDKRAAEDLFKNTIETAPYGLVLIDDRHQIILANHRTEQLFGYEEGELLGQEIERLIPDLPPIERIEHDETDIYHSSTRPTIPTYTHQGHRKDHSCFIAETVWSQQWVQGKHLTTIAISDITYRTKLEEHLRHSQKMEAVGLLSSGVAHDFNNLLGVIIGNLDLLGTMHPDDHKVQKRINGAMKAALSGALLTKRLLAFGRKQTLKPEVVDIAAEFEEMSTLLSRTLKGEVELKFDIPTGLFKVFIDKSEFENVILNMAINARDAMPNGGIFSMEAEKVYLDEQFVEVNGGNLKLGHYIHITLSDNGSGIAPDVISHIFEPFFTTKEKGKGTGLGLPMVHGFVTQSKGSIKVYSEMGIGTTFHIYLPVAEDQDDVVREAAENITDKQVSSIDLTSANSKTVLIVDDEADLAEIASAYLDTLGIKTVIAYSGEAALDILAKDVKIGLVLTDIVMPGGIDGIELHRRIIERFPSVKVVYTSGFSADAIRHKRGHNLNADLVQKPYRKQDLEVVIKKNMRT